MNALALWAVCQSLGAAATDPGLIPNSARLMTLSLSPADISLYFMVLR